VNRTIVQNSIVVVLPKSSSVRFNDLYLRTLNSTAGQVWAVRVNLGPNSYERVHEGSVPVQNGFELSNPTV
jgi:hypothetical protein